MDYKGLVTQPDTIGELEEGQVKEIVHAFQDLQQELKESSLVEISSGGDIVFVGDTHGDFETTKKVVKNKFLEEKNTTIVFLGDYVDRTPLYQPWGSVSNITYLLALKLLYPDKVHLLKGNHEAISIVPCFPHRFDMELEEKFGIETDLYMEFDKIFASLPLMVLTKKGLFAAHGGIIKGEVDIPTLRSLDGNSEEVVKALLWGDPEDFSPDRGADLYAYRYSRSDLEHFLESIGAKVMVRSHDYEIAGTSVYDDRLVTIFTSRSYGGFVLMPQIAMYSLDKEIAYGSDLKVEELLGDHWLDRTLEVLY